MSKIKKVENEVEEKEVEKFEEVGKNETEKNNFEQFQLNADNDILVDDYARLISEKEDLSEEYNEVLQMFENVKRRIAAFG